MARGPQSVIRPGVRMVNSADILALAEGRHGAPRQILGPHPAGAGHAGLLLRTFQPFAVQVDVIDAASGATTPLQRVHPAGLFEASLPCTPSAYRYRITDADGHVWEAEDPYRFPLQITDFDLYLMGEGTHYRTYLKMGAHPLELEDVPGIHFAVWAPNAARVSLVGDFNRWNGLHHPMQQREHSGLWELFLPGLQPGDLYKFEIRTQSGDILLKADPYAFASELRPQTASRVWDNFRYTWNDADWMARRSKTDWHARPLSIYEVHLGSWRFNDQGQWLTYRELAETLIPHVQELGFTHIELLPVTEHPFDGSWGYQTLGYYAPTSRFGTPDDLKFFIDRCHQAGLGVILDWVPAHFPRDEHGLAWFDGTHLYEHADPREGEHRDWGTLVFNYGRNEVRTFLLSNAMYWADVFHVDGLRVDAVASMLYRDYSRQDGEWIPNRFGGRENIEAVDFLKRFNEIVHAEHPGFLTFAEESTAWPMVSRPTYLGGLGFDFKWNMGWMHDTLAYFSKDPIYRKYEHNLITFSLLYAFTENFLLPFSHDEVVHGKQSLLSKMPGDSWQKFANLRLLYALLFAHPGKKLLFMGSELAPWHEWDCHRALDWGLLEHEPHHKLRHLMADLHRLYRSQPPLYEIDFSWEGFEWMDFRDTEKSIIAFCRLSRQPVSRLVCVFNFTPEPRFDYRIGVPEPGRYEILFNSDSVHYGGSNLGDAGPLTAEPVAWGGFDQSLRLSLPPLAALFLQPFRHPENGAGP